MMPDASLPSDAETDAARAFLTELESEARTTRTRSDDGMLVWRSWGDGAPVVLLHGGSGSWRHWARNIRPLAARRRVIVPDLPGMGDSETPPSAMGRRRVAEIVMQGLPGLIGDAARFDLVGFSYGGAVAGLATEFAGPRIRSLTLAGAGGFGGPVNDPPRVRLRHLEGTERAAAHRTNLLSLMIAGPSRVDALALEIQEQNTRRVRLNSLSDRDSSFLSGALANFMGPFNAIWGERDSFVAGYLPDRIDRLRAARPDADIRVIPGVGHWVAYEAADSFDAYLDSRLSIQTGADLMP